MDSQTLPGLLGEKKSCNLVSSERWKLMAGFRRGGLSLEKKTQRAAHSLSSSIDHVPPEPLSPPALLVRPVRLDSAPGVERGYRGLIIQAIIFLSDVRTGSSDAPAAGWHERLSSTPLCFKAILRMFLPLCECCAGTNPPRSRK